MKIAFNDRWGDEKKTGVSDSLSELVGEKVVSISGAEPGSYEIVFVTESGKAIKLYHEQYCCENVTVEDVDGYAQDLIGGIVISAEEIEGQSGGTEWGTYTWTFYKIETSKGGLFIRWNGESNGYYSESVSICGGRVTQENTNER
jgi:hypothetical protein